MPSDSIGTGKMEDFLDSLEDVNEDLEDEDISEKTAATRIKTIAHDTRTFVDQILSKSNPSQDEREDAVMGAVLLYSLGSADDFIKYITQIRVKNEKESFLLFLKSVSYLLKDEPNKANKYALRAMRSEPEAIEPVMIRIMALDKMDKYSEAMSEEKAFERFDEDHYKTPNSLKTAYNLLGDISGSRDFHVKAAYYHKKAVDEMGFLDDDDKKAVLYMKIANDYDELGSRRESRKYYEKAMDHVEDKKLKKALKLMWRN